MFCGLGDSRLAVRIVLLAGKTGAIREHVSHLQASRITHFPHLNTQLHLLSALWTDHCSSAAAAKSLKSCLTLCDPKDGSPLGSAIPGILQARTLEWVAISFSNAWKGRVKVKLLSRARLLATPWTSAHRLLHPWEFLGKSTGVGCHCLLRA